MDSRRPGLDVRVFLVAVLALTLLAGWLRFLRLGDPSLWADEMFQVRDAVSLDAFGYLETRWGLELAGVDTESVEPQAYATWKAKGLTEWNMRLGAALLGILSIPILTMFSAPFVGRPAALIAGLLLAVSTWHIDWSQHARFYTPMFLYYNGALALYFTATLLRTPWRLAALVASILLAAFAVDSKPTSLMLFAVIGTDLVFRVARGRSLRAVAPSTYLVLGLGGAAIFGTVLWDVYAGTEGYSEFMARNVGESPLRVIAGNALLSGVSLVAAAGLTTLFLLAGQPRVVVFLAAAVAVPLVCFGALAASQHVEMRYTFMNLYGWVVLAGLGLWRLFEAIRPQLGWAAALLPIAVLVAGSAYDDLVYYEAGYGNRPRWRHAFRYVEKHREATDSVVTLEKWAGQYYLEDPDVKSVDLDFTSLDSLTANTWFVLKTTAFETESGRRHWLDGNAEMRAVYPNRIPFPQATVRAYYYRVDKNQ